ncbi:ATP-binding protein [Kutzneria kofuensis]|uniref:ATP-binding protein n=1 Tax=Kutzneria kofuensis TaxID=103725 RepID=UPI0031EC05F4
MEALPFTGRSAVLTELGAALDRARAGRGGLVLVTGPAGAGKTRVAAEVAGRAWVFRGPDVVSILVGVDDMGWHTLDPKGR